MNNDVLTKEKVLEQLRVMLPELKKQYGVTQIGIFGSFARGEAGANSDIDIVVEMKPDIFKRAALKVLLEKFFNRKVDVIRYSGKVNSYLKQKIDKEAHYA